MKIQSSSVVLDSSRYYTNTTEKSENLKFWIGDNQEGTLNQDSEDDKYRKLKNDILEISEQGINLQKSNKTNNQDNDNSLLTDKDKLKIHMLTYFIRALTGKNIKIKIPELPKNNQDDLNIDLQPVKKAGWGLSYDFHETKYVAENTTFSADGIIKTKDGKEIKFSLDLSMSREFVQTTDVSLRAGDAVQVDPLVINFDGNAAQLTNNKFNFDIDNNGIKDDISFVTQKSGFLALDKNSDGKINNGGELFGPNTGDGFNELRQYDCDKNGWIDENDKIFDKLRIWTKDENGDDQLFALGQKGIGAIYVGNVNTLFNINNQNNEELGQVKSTGIYINENGSVGTIQHVDLVI